MPEGTSPLGVKRAVSDFAAKEFGGELDGHRYVMALHTYDTDPDPKPVKHPHVHLVVKAESRLGIRLNPRKADLQRWRDGFAKALNENGIEATSTPRQARLQFKYTTKKVVTEKLSRGEALSRAGVSANTRASPTTLERLAKAKVTEQAVALNYMNLIKALRASEIATDNDLAHQLFEYVKSIRNLNKQKDQGQER
jgi:hypothetical protein